MISSIFYVLGKYLVNIIWITYIQDRETDNLPGYDGGLDLSNQPT